MADILNRAAYGKERVVLTRRGKDVAAIVPMDDPNILEGAAPGPRNISVTTPAGSSTSNVTFTVLATTTTSISAAAVIYNADGVVTVTVTALGATPVGNVSLIVGGISMSEPLSKGSATFTIPSPNAGNHSLNASYAAQGDFLASSATGTLTVNAASTATTVTSSQNPSTFAQPVTFTATISPSTATGTVQFQIDGANFGDPVAVADGSASSGSTSTLAAGNHAVTAAYSGDGNFNVSFRQGCVNPCSEN